VPDLNPPAQASSVAAPEPVCLRDFEPLAKAKMSAMGWDYINSGAADEHTLRWNEEAYQQIRLKPHVLVDVSILQREFQMALALTGRTTISSIDRSVLWL